MRNGEVSALIAEGVSRRRSTPASLNVALTPFAIAGLAALFVLVTGLFLLPQHRLEETFSVALDIEKPAAVA